MSKNLLCTQNFPPLFTVKNLFDETRSFHLLVRLFIKVKKIKHHFIILHSISFFELKSIHPLYVTIDNVVRNSKLPTILIGHTNNSFLYLNRIIKVESNWMDMQPMTLGEVENVTTCFS
jgi:hypothetical protein